jgi:DNA repair exonuclease SbcCD ATPase subunit
MMIRETLQRIQQKLERSDSINQESKRELLELLSQLQTEIEHLSATDHEHAESIAGFAQASTHEAIRKDKKPDLTELSLQGFVASVEGFETSYPRLVEIVNRISTALANLGI